MAAKHKHRTAHGATGLFEQAQRSLEKGDFKQALKDAKVCHRQQPRPETRQLLQRAYLARGRQLHRAGLRAESQAVVEGLLELGATDASVEQELRELLVAVGLLDRALAPRRGTGPAVPPLQEGDPLYVVAADHAVLRPEGVPSSLPAIGQGVAAVRRALAALQAGDEARALACLADVSRASPFADWKYLVRGLAAYYRQDTAQMEANWDRLEPSRFAARIAAPLRALANRGVGDWERGAEEGRKDEGSGTKTDEEPQPSSFSDHRVSTLARLENAIPEGRALNCLLRLQEEMTAGRWQRAVSLLRVSEPQLRQADPGLPQRVATAIYATLVRKGAPAAVGSLARLMKLPLDPHGNRGMAMAWEHSRDGDPSDAEDCWRRYVEDLAEVECLAPAERTLAQALVWLRLGAMLGEESRPCCPTCGVCHDPDEALRDQAVACFENSLRLAPELLKAYEALANVHERWGEPERAAAAYRRLVERFSEDFAALLSLAGHHAKRDEPFAARDYLFRARRLKPLDVQVEAMIGGTHLACARQHAMAGRWDEGRAELAAAEGPAGRHAESHRVLVHRAVLEIKAGQFALAYRLLDRARSELGESAPVWFLAVVESTRHAAAAFVPAEFEGRWLKAIKKGRTSLAAGEMCRILGGYVTAGVDYPGRKEHVERLVDFLRRCSRTTWQARDLRSVMDFLTLAFVAEEKAAEESSGRAARRGHGALSGTEKLLVKLAAKARAKFPGEPYFHYSAGQMEIRKGPRKCDRRLARECFERVVQLTEGAGDPESLDLARLAKGKLRFLDDHEAPRRGGFSPSPFGPPDDSAIDLPDLFEDEDDDFDDDDDDFDDDGGPFPGGSPKGLFAMFTRACREAGLDPEEILSEMSGGESFRFRSQDGRKRKKKRKKAT